MQRASFEAVKAYLMGLEPQSGDAMLTKAFWHMLNLAPTDPGNPHSIVSNLSISISTHTYLSISQKP